MFRKSIITVAAAALFFLAAPAAGFASGGHEGGKHGGGYGGGGYGGGNVLSYFLGYGGYGGGHRLYRRHGLRSYGFRSYGFRGHGKHGHFRGHGRKLGYGFRRGYSRVYPRGFRAAVPYDGRSCRTVYKTDYVNGRKAKIGGTQCYDAYGGTFVVPNSRYVVHYY